MAVLSNPIVAITLFLGILVFVHELGHFLVGKAFGIGVEIFSIGFGPTLASFRYKETEYRLAILPLGGFVKFAGSLRSEPVLDSMRGKEFFNASLLARSLTLLAGPGTNFLLAVCVFSFFAFKGIVQLPGEIGHILPKGVADIAGLKEGDVITSVDGIKISNWEQLRDKVSESYGKNLQLTIKRNDQNLNINLTPETQMLPSQISGKNVANGRIGISPSYISSLISIKDKKSRAAQAGLENGDFIVGVTLKGNEQDAKRIVYLERHLQEALKNGEFSVPIRVRKQPEPIQLQATKNTDENLLSLSLDLSGLSSAEPILPQLGISHGQLLIYSAGETTEKLFARGDLLLSFAGIALQNIYDLSKILSDYKKADAEVEIWRAGQLHHFTAKLKEIDVQKVEGLDHSYTLDVTLWGQDIFPETITEQYHGVWPVLQYGLSTTFEHSKTLMTAIWGLITGDVPLKALGGPILIAKVAKDSVDLGLDVFLRSLALVSINLGLFNLLPIPALDGGQLFVLAVEGLRRKPLSDAAMENFQRLGFIFVMTLVILATYNDFSRFWGSILSRLGSG